jgi:hypothetical protein
VEVKDISGMAGAALELEGVREAVQGFEFCPGDKHFGRGSLRVRVSAAARMQPAVAVGHRPSPEPVDAAAHAAR